MNAEQYADFSDDIAKESGQPWEPDGLRHGYVCTLAHLCPFCKYFDTFATFNAHLIVFDVFVIDL
jgi:hypothetical protein